MENMNNVVTTENAAAEAANGATLGQKVLGGFLGACTVVGAVTITKKAVKGLRGLIGKSKANKANKQNQEPTVTEDSEDETK